MCNNGKCQTKAKFCNTNGGVRYGAEACPFYPAKPVDDPTGNWTVSSVSILGAVFVDISRQPSRRQLRLPPNWNTGVQTRAPTVLRTQNPTESPTSYDCPALTRDREACFRNRLCTWVQDGETGSCRQITKRPTSHICYDMATEWDCEVIFDCVWITERGGWSSCMPRMDTGAPSHSPTHSPTPRFTYRPTASPTKYPTNPTRRPTDSPTGRALLKDLRVDLLHAMSGAHSLHATMLMKVHKGRPQGEEEMVEKPGHPQGEEEMVEKPGHPQEEVKDAHFLLAATQKPGRPHGEAVVEKRAPTDRTLRPTVGRPTRPISPTFPRCAFPPCDTGRPLTASPTRDTDWRRFTATLRCRAFVLFSHSVCISRKRDRKRVPSRQGLQGCNVR